MNVRFVSHADARDLHERYGGALSRAQAEVLATAADACLLVLPLPLADSTRILLDEAGIVSEFAEHTTLLSGTRAAFERARDRAQREDLRVIAACLDAFDRAGTPAPRVRLRDRVLELGPQSRVMGIVNVTPDSFYERVSGVDAAVTKTRTMVAEGAALVDVGGRSYAHWNEPVSAEEEQARVVPAVRAIVDAGIDVALSIDTSRASVAEAALEAGAHLINDCSMLSDPALPGVVAKYRASLVVMHLKGELNVRDASQYVYRDALAEIIEALYEKTESALAAGVARDAIIIDPGLEFGKEPQTDLEILDRFAELRALGYPILFASSRKSFIGRVFDQPAKELLVPSLATAAIGIAAGARLLRVHDVRETAQLARMMAAVGPARRNALAVGAAMPGTPPAGN